MVMLMDYEACVGTIGPYYEATGDTVSYEYDWVMWDECEGEVFSGLSV